MPAKGTIEAGAAITSEFELRIDLLIPIRATRISGIERMVKTTMLPDQTIQSTSQVGPLDAIEIDVPLHHTAEILAMEGLALAFANGIPLGKGIANVNFKGADQQTRATILLPGFAVKGAKYPELNAGSDGAMAVVTFMCCADDANLI